MPPAQFEFGVNNMKLSLLAFLSLIALSGCHTIRYTNGVGGSVGPSYDEWHHIAVAQLVELSDPVDLRARCEGKSWSTITTELPFVHGLVGGLTFGIYTPHSVEYNCRRQ